MTRLYPLAIAMLLAACSNDPKSEAVADVGGLGGRDASVGTDAEASDVGSSSDLDSTPDVGTNDGCSADTLEDCEYVPPTLYELDNNTRTETMTYTDITGAERSFRVEVRRPVDGPEPSPLIVWSHGGASGISNPSGVGTEWGAMFARAGYVSIAIAHRGRTITEIQGICEALELGDCDLQPCTADADCSWGTAPDAEPGTCSPDAELGGSYCKFFKPLNWDRPNDVRAVLDWVEAEANGGSLDGVVDVSKIAYAGHSAGAGATMMAAGAARRYRATAADIVMIDSRPAVFMSCSPQGPDVDGFTEASFTRERCEELAEPAEQSSCLSRPHLVLTGVGDGDEGEVRRRSFDLAPSGERYLGYITEPAARHTTFEGSTTACERYAVDEGLGDDYPERCETYIRWLRSAALAFFDAKLRGDADAEAYLASDNLSTLGGDAFEWTRK